ncbi:MAG: AgmX/PglI C-terminal domain-containing protein [Kofleriaceae bacterium]
MWMRTLALIALAPALAFAKTSVSGAPDARAGGSEREGSRIDTRGSRHDAATPRTDARTARADEPNESTATIVLGLAGRDIVIDKLRVVMPTRASMRGESVSTRGGTRGEGKRARGSDELDGMHRVRLVFTMSTPSTDRRQAVMPLGLPEGARIVGAAVAIGNEARMVASMMSPAGAREEYQDVFRIAEDPLLVERVDPARDVHAIANDAFDVGATPIFPTGAAPSLQAFVPVPPEATDRGGYVNYVVRAFPLTERDKARVELTIELPDHTARLEIANEQRIRTLEIERATASGPNVRRRHDVREPIALDLPAPLRMPVSIARVADRVADRMSVDATHSLYAGFAPPIPLRGRAAVPTVSIDMPHGPLPHCGVDKTTIRRVVKQHMAQLARCYTRVTEYRGGQEGTAVMHFFIAQDGTVSNAFVDGEIEDVRITECLVDELVRWQFTPGDSGVMVHYPLTFKLAKN